MGLKSWCRGSPSPRTKPPRQSPIAHPQTIIVDEASEIEARHRVVPAASFLGLVESLDPGDRSSLNVLDRLAGLSIELRCSVGARAYALTPDCWRVEPDACRRTPGIAATPQTIHVVVLCRGGWRGCFGASGAVTTVCLIKQAQAPA